MTSTIKTIVLTGVIGAALTYASLAVPGRAMALCGDLGTPIYCPVLAYGFPLPFVADSQAISPVGAVARDPLSLLTGIDDVLWPQLGLSLLSWMLVAAAAVWAARRWRRRATACADSP